MPWAFLTHDVSTRSVSLGIGGLSFKTFCFSFLSFLVSCLQFKLSIFVFRVILIKILSLLFCCFISRVNFCVVVTDVAGACVLPALAWFCFVLCRAGEGTSDLMVVTQVLPPTEMCAQPCAYGV